MEIIWPERRVASVPPDAIVVMSDGLYNGEKLLVIYTDPQGCGDFDNLYSMESIGVPSVKRRSGGPREGGPRPIRA